LRSCAEARASRCRKPQNAESRRARAAHVIADLPGRVAAQCFLGASGLGRERAACYHQSCDTVANVNLRVLDQMADAAAAVALLLAT
jgi:hypothetical protein